MQNRVTIYEVAERAGVSIATVSNALNQPDRVRDATRRKVLQAIDELGFEPKAQAVDRARRGVGRIGVIAPVVSYDSYLRRLTGVLEAVGRRHLDVCVYDAESATTQASLLASTLPLNSRLDGLIVMGVPLEEDAVQRLLTRSLPTVLVDLVDDRFCSVAVDDGRSGELLADHLVDLGHRRVAYVVEQHAPSTTPHQGAQRLDRFRERLAGHGLGSADLTVAHVPHRPDAAREAAHRLLSGDDPPTAIAAHDDLLAIGVLQACRSLGVAIPGDVAVTGCDDGPVALAADLTTVRQPFEESGRVAAELLLEQMERGPFRRLTMLDQDLVVRGSTTSAVIAGDAA